MIRVQMMMLIVQTILNGPQHLNLSQFDSLFSHNFQRMLQAIKPYQELYQSHYQTRSMKTLHYVRYIRRLLVVQ